MIELLSLVGLAWLVLAKATYDEISSRARPSTKRWKIACFASIGPPIILYGIACRLLRKA